MKINNPCRILFDTITQHEYDNNIRLMEEESEQNRVICSLLASDYTDVICIFMGRYTDLIPNVEFETNY